MNWVKVYLLNSSVWLWLQMFPVGNFLTSTSALFTGNQFASEPRSGEVVTDCFLRRSHLQDLKDVTHNIHYETYRVRRLNESNMNFSELVLTSWPLKNGTDTCETESQL